MNVFSRYAVRSMHANKARTIVTIIGMALSMALFTAVIEGAASALTFFRDMTVEQDGGYHAVLQDVSDNERKDFLKNSAITKSVTFQEVGYASESDYPYIRILSGKPQKSILNISLTSGSWPENSDEIVLPQSYMDSQGNSYQLHQTITLNTGIPYKDGKRAALSDLYDFDHEDRNELKDSVSRTYTITGFYQRLPEEVNGGNNDTAFTNNAKGDGITDTYFCTKNINRINDLKKTVEQPDHLVLHEELIRYCNPGLSNMSHSAVTLIYGFAAVLIVLVLAGSISMIANSFSISISERMKDYGMLKSIGASRKQIRACVLTEALLSSLYGIVPGMLLGFGGLAVVIHLVSGRLVSAYGDSATRMRIVLSWPGLITAIVICLLTALIAAWRPASTAMRVTPVESIRRTDETGKHSEHVHTGRLTWKLFGLEGALTSRNLSRNHNRFRSIVFSLTISVVLFVSASSLCSYLSKAVNLETQKTTADITVNVNHETGVPVDSMSDTSKLFTSLKNLNGIKNGSWGVQESVDDLTVPANDITSEYCQYGDPSHCDDTDVQMETQEIMFLDDVSFRQMLKENGISDSDTYFDSENPKAVLYNHESTRTVNDKIADLTFLNPNSFPLTMSVTGHQKMDGSTYITTCGDDDAYACYLSDGQDPETADEDNMTKIPLSQSAQTEKLVIGASVENTGLAGITQPMVIYPASAYSALKETGIVSGTYYEGQLYFRATDHKAAASAISQYLSEHNCTSVTVTDEVANTELSNSIIFTVRVFSVAFILLVSLIAMANIFNTIATNMQVRKKEFAMLRSVGMTSKGFRKMLVLECLTYGIRSLLISLPLSVLMTYVIYRITNVRQETAFYIPVYAVIIAVISVFVIIILSMIYGWHKLRKENLVETLRSETA